MRQARVGFAHGSGERIDDLVLDHVGAVAKTAGAGVVPPRVLDLLVLRQRVGDQGEQADLVAEGLADRLARGLAHRPVPIGQLVQRGADGQVLIAQPDAHRCDRFVEQAYPGGIGGEVAFVGQLLQFIGQLVRTEDPQVAQPRAIAGQGGIGQLRLQQRVIQPVQLQGEEDQVAADRRHLLIHRLVESPDRRIGRILGEQKLGIGGDPPEQFLDPLILADDRRQRRSGQLGQRAGVGGGEGFSHPFGLRHILLHLGAVGAGIEVGQVPGRQRGGSARIIHLVISVLGGKAVTRHVSRRQPASKGSRRMRASQT